MAGSFEWESATDEIPARWDLRLVGWTLHRGGAGPATPRLFDGRPAHRCSDWRQLFAPRLTAVVGVDCAAERAAMLAHGMGEALGSRVAPAELAIRLARLTNGPPALPRQRQVGPLMLDLLHRDARAENRWLALHPREFAVLWRLADADGAPVSREALIADVWRLNHVPETNSLAVHVSRLRAKLAAARAGWLVETAPAGGYRLAAAVHERGWTAPAAMRTLKAM